MRPGPAAAIVFCTSAAILVVEIAAGRLVAPYVGVSLETFTAIIGVILAGIATGAGIGGYLADRREPRTLLGPSLWVGGLLVWVSVPVVQAIGPAFTDHPVSIIVLALIGFFLPAAVLSASSPIVAKLRLASLDRTGSVFGSLSAAGTAGGILGSFLTGFVFVAAFGTRATLFGVGALLVAGGIGLDLWLRRRPPTATMALLVGASGLAVFGLTPPCEYETRYACAEVVVDDRDPSRVDLVLDTVRNAEVDLDDDTYLGLRYIRLIAAVAEALPEGPVDALHIGGGGFTVPRWLAAVRPGSRNHVVEIDGGVVDIARDRLGLVTGPDLTVEVTDARTALPRQDADTFDLVVGDAFSGFTVPWHLTTVETAEAIQRVLRSDGIYVMNVIDGGEDRFARAELATLAAVFEHVALILPAEADDDRARNQVLVASDAPLPVLRFDAADGRLVEGDELVAYIDGANPLRDDFAPADQLAES